MEKTMTVNGRIAETRDTRKSEMGKVDGRKRSHVAIWLEILRDVSSHWEEAEHGRFRVSTR